MLNIIEFKEHGLNIYSPKATWYITIKQILIKNKKKIKFSQNFEGYFFKKNQPMKLTKN